MSACAMCGGPATYVSTCQACVMGMAQTTPEEPSELPRHAGGTWTPSGAFVAADFEPEKEPTP